MNYLILITIILCSAGQSPVTIYYNRKTDNKSPYIYSAITTFATIIFFLITSGNPDYSCEFLGYSLGFGTAYTVATVFSVLALACGSLALTSLVVSFSLMIPTLYGVIFLNEPSSTWFYAGIVTLLISLFLINYKKEDGQITLKWGILVLIAAIGNGMCSTVQKMEQLAFNGNYKSEFMIVALIFVFIVTFLLSFIKTKRDIVYCLKKGWHLSLVYGFLGGALNLLVMILGNRMSVSLMFPMISAGGLVISYFLSKYLFKEKFTKMQIIGYIAGIISIVFLNL